MKNELGIEIKCENCWNSSLNTWLATGNKCELYREDGKIVINTKRCRFWITDDAYNARIKELQQQVEELEAENNGLNEYYQEQQFTEEELNTLKDILQDYYRVYTTQHYRTKPLLNKIERILKNE